VKAVGWILVTLLSHWRRHPVQAVTLIVGLALATALWSGVQAVNQEARRSYAEALDLLLGQQMPTLISSDGQRFSQDVYVALRRTGWAVSPILEGRISINGQQARLVGVEPLTLAGLGGGVGLDSETARSRAFLTPPWRTLAASGTLKALGLQKGDAPIIDENRSLPPVAVLDELPPGALIVDIGVAQRLLAADGLVSRLVLGEQMQNGRTPLRDIVGERLQIVGPRMETDISRLTDSFHLNLTAFGLLSFGVGLFIVNSTIGLAFEQRRPAMRSMRACGVSLGALTAALLLELLTLAVIAGLSGLILGYIIAAALLPDVAATLRGLYGATVSGELTLNSGWWLTGLAMSLGGAGIAATGSLTKIRGLSVLESTRQQAWLTAQRRRHRWQLWLALFLFSGAALLLEFGEGLLSGFAIMGGFLLGGALALPTVLARILELGERLARHPLAKWMWADSRQQLSGLSLALMALLVALSANVGVGSMVGGFRLTFTDWLDDVLGAEIYIRTDTSQQTQSLTDFLADRPEVTAILPHQTAQSRLAGLPVGIEGVTSDRTSRQNGRLLAGGRSAWQEMQAGSAALINEQLANRLEIEPGDRISLPTPTGVWDLRVAGIYADYGNSLGELRVSLDAFRARWREVEQTNLSVRLPHDAVPGLMTDLREEFPWVGGRMVDQSTLKDISQRIFDRTFAVTAALNTLTLGVAGIALLLSLLTLVSLRLPQVAPLWAMGIIRRNLVLMDVGKTLALAAMTTLLAIPLGGLVAWCLVAVVNVQAFGWRLPLHLFPLQWLQLLGLALLAASLAAILPAIRLWRRPPAELIKVLSDER